MFACSFRVLLYLVETYGNIISLVLSSLNIIIRLENNSNIKFIEMTIEVSGYKVIEVFNSINKKFAQDRREKLKRQE